MYAIGDPVTHEQLQLELARLRKAVLLLMDRSGQPLSTDDTRRIIALLAAPHERVTTHE